MNHLKQQDAAKLLKFSQPRFHLNENLPVAIGVGGSLSSAEALCSLCSVRQSSAELSRGFRLYCGRASAEESGWAWSKHITHNGNREN